MKHSASASVFMGCILFLLALPSCTSSSSTNWGDQLVGYATQEFMPPDQYHWDWAQATLLRAVADRWELGIDKENMLSYIRQSMNVTMDQAVGIHPNAVASAFGMALMARATGEDKYRQKAFEIYEQYLQIVRAGNGGVSHRDNVTELWDDTVYMISLFLNEMYLLTGEEKYLRETAFQLMAHQEKLEDPKTGLWYHGWDGDSIDFDDGCCMLGWADNPERRGGQFWGRGNGWVAMTLANTLHLMPQKMEERDQLLALFHKMMQTLIPLQDEKTGHWYQLPLFPGEENNFIESSSTAMFGYAMALGIADGLLPEETYRPVVEKAYKGIETYSLEPLGNFLNITNVCSGTCIGDKAYYYGREVVAGTPFALGAAIMFHDRYF